MDEVTEELKEQYKFVAHEYKKRAEAAEAEVARLQKIVSEYDHVITWDTTCANCANLLDRCYSETMRDEVHKIVTAADIANAPCISSESVSCCALYEEHPDWLPLVKHPECVAAYLDKRLERFATWAEIERAFLDDRPVYRIVPEEGEK